MSTEDQQSDKLDFDSCLFIRMGANSKQISKLVENYKKLIKSGCSEDKAMKILIDNYKYKYKMPDEIIERLNAVGFSKLEKIHIDLAYENFIECGHPAEKVYEILRIEQMISDREEKTEPSVAKQTLTVQVDERKDKPIEANAKKKPIAHKSQQLEMF